MGNHYQRFRRDVAEGLILREIIEMTKERAKSGKSRIKHGASKSINPESGARLISNSPITKAHKQMLLIQTNLNSLLSLASPNSTAKAISWTCVDFAGLWEVSKNHISTMRRLLKCSYPRDRKKIEDLLTEIQVNLLSQGADHLKTLQVNLPRIRRDVFQNK